MSDTIESIKPSLKIPPHSIEAEQAVLGGLMIDNNAWEQVVDRLTEMDFYRNDHRIIFRAMASLAMQDKPIDLITISERLEAQQELNDVGGLGYLGQIAKNTPSAANIGAYAEIVKERATLRQLIEVGSEIVGSGFEPKGRVASELLDEAERKVFAIAERGSSSNNFGPQGIAEVLSKTVERIEKLFESDSPITGISSGFSDFDRLTSGMQQSDLIIVAGRPSMGKTTFAMNIAEYVGMKSQKPVLIFSMEMPAEQLAMRMLSSLGRIEMQRIRSGQLDDGDWPRLSSAIAMMSEKKIFIDDSGALGPGDIRARARRLVREHGDLGLIVIDYLQLMRVPGNSEHRAAEISEISRSLKALARELDVPIIALSQLNRSLEQRTDRRPMMSDLRECVTADTLVHLSDGSRVPIAELEGKNAQVHCIDDKGKLVSATADLIWKVGDKETFKVHLASGRSITATAEHLLYSINGWKKLNEISVGEHLGVARVIPEPEQVVVPLLKETADNDIFWDRVVAITPMGVQPVYDLTVPGYANWLADSVISHNSGAIEQDADLIVFIYRDEVYNKDTAAKGTAEIIVAKQRNGPIGTVRLTFLGHYSRFENFTNRAMDEEGSMQSNFESAV
jgi:replicative DNA helicase